MRQPASLLLTAAAVVMLTTVADARPRHHQRDHRARVVVTETNGAPPLTIRKRSFLDPGNVVPVGSRQNYVTTVGGPGYNPMEEGFGRSKFGNETLPSRFDLPGRPVNLLGYYGYSNY